MQSSFGSTIHPQEILEWLQNEMEYRQLGFYSTKHSFPSTNSIRKVYRGNMIPVWNFLIKRVKSEKMVDDIRKNIVVHGTMDSGTSGKWVGREKSGSRDVALKERELAEKEVERLRWVVRRKRKELKDAMVEVAKEKGERKRMLDERADYRHKQAMLEAYDRQCDESTKLFSEYHKRLRLYVTQAKDAEGSRFDVSEGTETSFKTKKGKGRKSEVVLNETEREIKVGKICEYLATLMSEKIYSSFSAYEGSEIHVNTYPEAAKLGFDYVGNLPTDIEDTLADCLSSPPLLLQAITNYTQRLKAVISREVRETDVGADVEALRYKFENDVIVEASSPDKTSALPFGIYINEKLDSDTLSSSIKIHLTERQRAHVQRFLAIENALNLAAEARTTSELLLKCLHGSSDAQNMSGLRKLKLQVWSKEREAAGLQASVKTLISEANRLNKLCEDRKEAESSLRKKWKKIEEQDACMSELGSVYNALLKANMDAVAFLNKQALAAKECASILPACNAVMDLSNNAKDLIYNEVSAFYQMPSNSLYMLPSTPQALMESMSVTSYSGPEAVAIAERNATLLTARAGSMDPSAIPSICRISAALQYPAGLDGMDAGLASVLESMEFCLRPRGSEACILEDLDKAINLVQVRRELVESDTNAHRALHEHDRTTTYCLNVAAEQEKIVTEKWLPELSNAAQNAERCLQELRSGLFEEWLELASTVVDWVSVDGENVSAWQNNAKQLDAFFDKSNLDKPSFWESYLNLKDKRFKLSERCPHCVKLYFS